MNDSYISKGYYVKYKFPEGNHKLVTLKEWLKAKL